MCIGVGMGVCIDVHTDVCTDVYREHLDGGDRCQVPKCCQSLLFDELRTRLYISIHKPANTSISMSAHEHLHTAAIVCGLATEHDDSTHLNEWCSCTLQCMSIGYA